MADWEAIKAEYITTATSYRKLAKKYGITYDEIGKQSRREGWVQLKKQHNADVLSTILSEDIQAKADAAVKLNGAALELLAKVQAFLGGLDAEVVSDTQVFRHISGTLRDLKDVLMVRSEADMREQEARIASLKHQVEKDSQERDTSIEVVFAAGPEEWNE